MAARKKRKRYRDMSTKALSGGDRSASPTNSGGSGGSLPKSPHPISGLWCDPSTSELRLLRKAINADWPVPEERRRPIIEEIFPAIDGPPRLALAVTRVVIAAEAANLRFQKQILKTSQRLKSGK
jgi:hypothetical protein